METLACKTGRLSSSEIFGAVLCIVYFVFRRLPREIAESPSLEILKPCLDSSDHTALDDPAQSEGLDQMTFRAAFKPWPHCESQLLKTKHTIQNTDSVS